MEGILNQYLDQIKIGGKQVYKNLALDGQVAHLSVFGRPKNEQEGHRFSRMGSFSNRRGGIQAGYSGAAFFLSLPRNGKVYLETTYYADGNCLVI